MSVRYPLSAIVGQGDLIEALLVNAVAPDVGGVLVRGQRGTAKSTAVRALAPLLPAVAAAEGHPFAFAPGEIAPGGRVPADVVVAERAAPLVELPLGATLDRLVGSLDLGRALAGEQAFEAGLLARAHRGILYVDEVNLLPDHLVDALLDAAASGVARVEREAVSVEHAARFLLVGTMNVEEGELRPQLLDRFGLGVEVRGPSDPAERAEIVRRRLAFERDPEAFAASWRADELALAERIAAARGRLSHVRLPERELLRITGACARLGVDGVRGDLVCARAAQVLAALDGADEVDGEHVRRAAALALVHRRRRDPLAPQGADDGELEQALAGDPDGQGPPDDPSPGGAGGGTSGRNGAGAIPGGGEGSRAPEPGVGAPGGAASQESGTEPGSAQDGSGAGPQPRRLPHRPDDAPEPRSAPDAPAPRARRDAPATALLPPAALRLGGSGTGPAGRRARTHGPGAGAIDTRPAAPDSDDLAIVGSLRDRLLGGRSGGLREHVRAGRESALVCVVVDASGSMAARRRLARVKGALVELLRDAYARRDRVAIVAFRGGGAEVLVAPGAPLERAGAAVRDLPTGGRTPLAAGLDAATDLIRREGHRDRTRRALAVVLTDGRVGDGDGAVRRAAARLGNAAEGVHVVDTEDGAVRVGIAADLAAAAGAELHRLAPAIRRAA